MNDTLTNECLKYLPYNLSTLELMGNNKITMFETYKTKGSIEGYANIKRVYFRKIVV
jgi:hypothetical protein